MEEYLTRRTEWRNSRIERLTPDASTREYFRILWKEKPAVACVYPEPFSPEEQTYLDVTRLFLTDGLPVAEIYNFDGPAGIIIQEDLGNRILRDVLQETGKETAENYLNRAIGLIARIQKLTETAFAVNSIASRLKFDREKLNWELDFYKTHYFTSLRKKPLSPETDQLLFGEFCQLSEELEGFAGVLCHRDYHAANLMLDSQDQLRIIDHQDARIGPVSYDLVSLLLDRVLETPAPGFIKNKKDVFLSEREKLGLENHRGLQFDYEFDLMTVQRCLKAIGTFSNQTANCGKKGYTKFIKPMYRIVLEASERLQKFPVLQEIIKTELEIS